jgi:hypothetical protein
MQTVASLPTPARSLTIAGFGRNRLVLGAAVLGVIAAVVAWHWSWLIAIGVAPLLLSVAPCAAMCGLGLCMHRMSGRTCAAALQGEQSGGGISQISSATQEI